MFCGLEVGGGGDVGEPAVEAAAVEFEYAVAACADQVVVVVVVAFAAEAVAALAWVAIYLIGGMEAACAGWRLGRVRRARRAGRRTGDGSRSWMLLARAGRWR